MKKVERNKYRKKVNTNHKAFAFYLYNCPKEPVSEFVNTLRDCEFNEKWRRVLEPEEEYYHYHPDHLGSSSWITDQYGTPVQHIQYLPFGETWADQRSANWNAPYTFSGKEKDWETSYHYYGARYYDSEISIWLSIDPLASKYPHQSNYVYCSNNPIKLIDPDGRDEWDLCKEGYLTKREGGRTDIDIVHAVDAKGNNVNSRYAQGTIKEFTTGTGDEGSIDYMQISNATDAARFYEFAADNTNVEWAHKSTSEGSFVGTSHDIGMVASGYMDIPSTALVYEDSHSHTSRGRYSTSDFNLLNYNGPKGIKTSIYHQGTSSYSVFKINEYGNKTIEKEISKTLKFTLNFFVKPFI